MNTTPSTKALEVYNHATKYHSAGIAVIPLRTDGSKAPVVMYGQYRNGDEAVTAEMIADWFRHTPRGIGALTGVNGFTAIDIDNPDIVDDFLATVPPNIVAKLCAHRSPREGGGRHLIYRRAVDDSKKRVFAYQATGSTRPDGKPDYKAAIESTNYIALPGSAPGTHKSGKDYTHVAGPSVLELEVLTEGEHDQLVAIAESFNERPRDQTSKPNRKPRTKLVRRPGDDYMARATWEEVFACGDQMNAEVIRTAPDGTRFWRHASKSNHGHSFTTDGPRHVSKEGNDLMLVYSTSMSPFEVGEGGCGAYNKFNARVLLEYGEINDDTIRRTAEKLEEEGYTGRKASDRDIAELIAHQHPEIKFVREWNRFYTHDKTRWRECSRADIDEAILDVTRRLPTDYAGDEYVQNLWKTLESNNKLRNIASAWSGIRSAEISQDAFDTDPWLFNCQNGAVDLRTGDFREHRLDDYATVASPVEFSPKATCPRFDAFISEIMCDDEDLKEYVMTFLGLCLTGNVDEHILPIWHGDGCNGKSTLINVIEHILGGYFGAADSALIMRGQKQHPTELADLKGKRLVVIQESRQGAKFDEGAVKKLTGGDTIQARRMREDFWTFRPTNKLVLVTNRQPMLDSADGGIRRRVQFIPFDFKADIPDPNLERKLIAEASGILNRLIKALQWYLLAGLNAPSKVTANTNEYFDSQDLVDLWIAERCLTGAELGEDPQQAKTRVATLHSDYSAWCIRRRVEPCTAGDLGTELENKGYVRKRTSSARCHLGIRLKDPQDKNTMDQSTIFE